MKDVAEVRELTRSSRTLLDRKYGVWLERRAAAFPVGAQRHFKKLEKKR